MQKRIFLRKETFVCLVLKFKLEWNRLLSLIMLEDELKQDCYLFK